MIGSLIHTNWISPQCSSKQKNTWQCLWLNQFIFKKMVRLWILVCYPTPNSIKHVCITVVKKVYVLTKNHQSWKHSVREHFTYFRYLILSSVRASIRCFCYLRLIQCLCVYLYQATTAQTFHINCVSIVHIDMHAVNMITKRWPLLNLYHENQQFTAVFMIRPFTCIFLCD